MSGFLTNYYATRKTEQETDRAFFSDLRDVLAKHNCSPFQIQGDGSGDSPETAYLVSGECPPFVDFRDWNPEGLQRRAWRLSDADYNNEGGGWHLTWDGMTLELKGFNYETIDNESETW